MKLILLAMSILSSIAFAETTTVTVEGMHCSACRKMVEAKVCADTAVKNTTESCKVKIIDEAKQIGQITLVTKKGATLDMKNVESGVAAAGTEFKVTKKEIK